MTDIKTVHTTEQLLDMWDQASRRNDPHPQLAFARAIEAAVLAARAPAQEPVADEFHRHEVLDRTHVIQTMLNELLDEHPGMTPELTALYEKSVGAIHDLYQAAGNERFSDAARQASQSPQDQVKEK